MTTPLKRKPKEGPHMLRAAVKLIASGYTAAEVAQALGVHPSTIDNWKRHPDWASMLEAEGEKSLGRIDRRLSKLIDKSIDVIEQALGSDNASEVDKARIAFGALDRIVKIHEVKQRNEEAKRGEVPALHVPSGLTAESLRVRLIEAARSKSEEPS